MSKEPGRSEVWLAWFHRWSWAIPWLALAVAFMVGVVGLCNTERQLAKTERSLRLATASTRPFLMLKAKADPTRSLVGMDAHNLGELPAKVLFASVVLTTEPSGLTASPDAYRGVIFPSSHLELAGYSDRFSRFDPDAKPEGNTALEKDESMQRSFRRVQVNACAVYESTDEPSRRWVVWAMGIVEIGEKGIPKEVRKTEVLDDQEVDASESACRPVLGLRFDDP